MTPFFKWEIVERIVADGAADEGWQQQTTTLSYYGAVNDIGRNQQLSGAYIPEEPDLRCFLARVSIA